MKTNLLAIIFLLTFAGAKSQGHYMCGVMSSSATSGTIYDSGGPSSYYSNYEYCDFLIYSACPGNITLTFSSFNTEQYYDVLTVYNGSTTSSPVLGIYSGYNLPPTLMASSGYMLLTWSSNSYYNYSGFQASWTKSNASCPPVANFNMTTNSCQGRVNFSNASTGNPTSYIWNFGDGNASTSQNPSHTYTMAGTYSVTLIVGNSQGYGTTTKTVTVNPILFKIGYLGQPLMNAAMSFTTDFEDAQVYTWDFGDGTVSGSANAIHTYTSMGTYKAALTIASNTCVTTSTMQVKIMDGVGIQDLEPLIGNVSIQPNPSFGSSTIDLQLTKESAVTIEVMNQFGQLIKVLRYETLSSGDHTFQLTDMPPGINYVVISADNNKRVFKLVSL